MGDLSLTGGAGAVGVDTGGTFTDVVGADGRITKVLSERADPAAAVRRGIGQLGGATALAHGTTVATNAVLERRGGRVALVTTRGFADVIEIGRQHRPALYDPFLDRPEPLVPRWLRFEVDGRIGPAGEELEPLDLASVPDLPAEVEAVAVCLLHADRSPAHEQAVAEVLRARGFDVTCSSEVSPEFREYERTVTTVLNAYLRPPCRRYLEGLAGAAPDVTVLTSAGGLVPLAEGADRPAALLLSGPAGGVAAGAAAAVSAGHPDAVTFDMGGTSTDVCLVLDGRPAPAAQRSVGGFPVRLPSLDVHTIGAGGGSIARLDAGGALVVGPESAGASPGPAAYGLGGTAPTVTDADLVAGHIGDDSSFPGLGALDVDAAQRALDAAGVTAEGVIAVVDESMVQAVRAVTVAQGVDPRGLALVAFGGAGPLHACAVAGALGMQAVIVPPRAGVLSAVGILGASRQADLVRSWSASTGRDLEDDLVDLAVVASRAVGGGATVDVAVDCRYEGQSHELTVPDPSDFAAEHERRNGYARPDAPVEVIALRASARVPPAVALDQLPPAAVERRGPVAGPSVIREPDCTIWVPEGWTADVGAGGSWILIPAPEHAPEVQRATESLDAAGLQVLISQLTGIAEEMGAVLRRAAFSPNIKERADCSAALFTADGQLLVQAEHIPVHLGSMPASVRAAIESVGVERLRPGDQVILNDPFAGGTHLNDITLVAPCFVDGRLVGWAANRAHHADVGGMVPGSIPPEATEIQQEGFRIPPVVLTDDVVALLCANSRTPVERRGDLDAQLGANAVGVERLAAFAGAPLDEVLAYGERRMRAALAAVPDGRYRFADAMDSSGPRDDQRAAVPIVVEVTVAGDEVTFDFTGSGAQTSGNVNAVRAVTDSCVAFALRSACDPTIPASGGAMRPVRIVTPAGSIVDAAPPAAVGAGNVEVSQRVADVCLGALALALPDRVGAASQGTMNNLIVGGDGWVYYETVAGGQGGRPGGRAGMSGVHTGMTNTLNTPVEALERAFPMRVLRSSLRSRSGGAGQGAGGDGIERDLLMLEDVTVSLITERRSSPAWGLAGGSAGAVGENWLLPQGDESRAEPLLDKCTVRLGAGDVLRMRTPGGGGWGAPTPVTVRAMVVDDIEAVQRVERAAGERFRSIADPRIARCADDDPMGVEPLAALVDAGRAWVAVADGELIGFVAVDVVDGCGHVEEVAVAPAWSGRGIGSVLLERAAGWAVDEGSPALTLTTFRDVPWNRPFYERRGFSVVEEDALSAAQRALLVEEEHHGLVRELRVFMRRDLGASVAVRDATADDLRAITGLFNALIPTTTVAWRDHLADDTEMITWFEAQAQAGNPVLVAELGGEVAGYTTWTWFRGGERFPGYRHTRELTIHVDERHHGKGIGRALIEALVERARATDVHALVAGVDAANDASVEFHRRLGFEVVATMPEVGRKFDRWLDLVLLQRRID